MEKPIEAAAAAKDAVFHQIVDPLFYFFLMLGLALLIYGLILRRGTFAGRRIAVTGTVVLFALIAGYCQVGIDKERGFIVDQERRITVKLREIERKKGKEEALKMQYMYMPTKNSLFYFTLGNPSLAADYVWLTGLQYVSNSFRRGQKFDMLSRFHKTMVDLDPHWIDAEINGGKVLSALIDEREKSEECFLYAIRQNPTSWKLLNEAGLLYVMPPADPKMMGEYSRRAANYFELARKQKDCPKEAFRMLDDRVARLRLESGKEYYIQAEMLLYKNATDPENPPGLRDLSKGEWLKAHSMAMAATLTEVAKDIKKKTGAFPKTLKEIVAVMVSPDEFKHDAYAQPFDYNPETGEVSSHGANALLAIQASNIVNQLIENFRADNFGIGPLNLLVFRDYVRKSRKPPFYPANVMVIGAIGTDLDPSVGPLGPWNYDPFRGKIILPRECNAKELYSHVKDHFK